MMLQRLATGATGVKQARYRRRPTRGSEALARACAVYSTTLVYVRPAYEFRRGFCTLVLSFIQEMMPLSHGSGSRFPRQSTFRTQ